MLETGGCTLDHPTDADATLDRGRTASGSWRDDVTILSSVVTVSTTGVRRARRKRQRRYGGYVYVLTTQKKQKNIYIVYWFLYFYKNKTYFWFHGARAS
jgi:hypothetical protein